MKIAVAQINPIIGNFEGNKALILDRIKWAKLNKADIIVFPELVITGYPPKDLLENSDFIDKNLEVLNEVVKESDENFGIVIGFISRNEANTGKPLFNSAAFATNGKVECVQHKSLLPTYDVFNEARYFDRAKEHKVIWFKGRKFGITICEDVWVFADIGGRKLYHVNPVEKLKDGGAEFVLNCSSSPYIVEKRLIREEVVGSLARKYSIPIVYANVVGGNDELIFDGGSMVFNEKGEVVKRGTAFCEDAFIIDIDDLPEKDKTPVLSEIESLREALVLGIRDYIHKCGFKKVVIGLSGGIDSAVVAALAADAVGMENVMGVSMPTRYTDKRSAEVSETLAKNLGIPFRTIAIDNLYENYLELLKPEFKDKKEDVTEENIQARIRGNILMAFSNKYAAIMLSTGNKSELAVGYCTLYGDLAGGLAVISDVPKTTVYRLAEHINRDEEIIPEFIIKRPPSAELRSNQTDQDTLPPYDVLDKILKAYVEEHKSVAEIVKQGHEKEVVTDVIHRVKSNEYKRRQAPTGLKVTSKAFGWGRWYPIACKY